MENIVSEFCKGATARQLSKRYKISVEKVQEYIVRDCRLILRLENERVQPNIWGEYLLPINLRSIKKNKDRWLNHIDWSDFINRRKA
jgi:hypothetical protein